MTHECYICKTDIHVGELRAYEYAYPDRKNIYICVYCACVYETIKVPEHIPTEQYDIYRREITLKAYKSVFPEER